MFGSCFRTLAVIFFFLFFFRISFFFSNRLCFECPSSAAFLSARLPQLFWVPVFRSSFECPSSAALLSIPSASAGTPAAPPSCQYLYVLVNLVPFSLRPYLRTKQSPYALHSTLSAFREFSQRGLWNCSSVSLTQWLTVILCRLFKGDRWGLPPSTSLSCFPGDGWSAMSFRVFVPASTVSSSLTLQIARDVLSFKLVTDALAVRCLVISFWFRNVQDSPYRKVDVEHWHMPFLALIPIRVGEKECQAVCSTWPHWQWK